MVLGDDAVELGGDRLLVQAGVGQVEVEPALAVADLPAGHVALDDRAQHMHAGVDAHAAIALLPVDLGAHLGSGGGQGGARFGNVDDVLVVGALARLDDADLAAVFQAQHAAVARLAAARGIEDGAVQADAAFVGARHRGLAGLPIGVVAKNQFHGFLNSLIRSARASPARAGLSRAGRRG